MISRRRLTFEQKLIIVRLRSERKKIAQIAAIMKYSQRTIERVLQQSKKPSGIALKPKSGRKPCTSVREDRLLRRLHLEEPSATAVALKQMWKQPVPSCGTVHARVVSERTVRRRLKSFGLNNYVKIQKAPLNARQKNLRFQFCLRHKDWTADDWRTVLFSDECNLELEPSGGCRTVWRTPQEKLSDFAIIKVNSLFLILRRSEIT